jgi:excinuclease ABC subunit C
MRNIPDNLSGFPYPQKPGVYMMRDSVGKIIYIGKAKDLRKRIKSYFIDSSSNRDNQHWKTSILVSKVKNIDYIITDNEIEAFLLESNLIKKYRPVYNIELKDQQRYTYLRITNEKFPRLNVARRNRKGDLSNEAGEIIGPFVKGSSRYLTVGLLRKMFKIRICNSLPKRECLEYHIGNCDAPCINKVNSAQYMSNVESLRNILNNNNNLNEFCQKLEGEMKEASKNKEFERAIYFRDTIHRLQNLLENQKIESSESERSIQEYMGFYTDKLNGIVHVMTLLSKNGVIHDMKKYQFDLIGDNSIPNFISQYYLSNPEVPSTVFTNIEITDAPKLQEIISDITKTKVRIVTLQTQDVNEVSENMDHRMKNTKIMRLLLTNLNSHIEKGHEPALDDLVQMLGLKKLPYIIDCFDVSNFGDNYAVGACTRFVNGKPKKNEYMKFKVKKVNRQNDFLMMDELIKRRYGRAHEHKSQISNQPEVRENPDLILIDGGRGHLNIALSALEEIGFKETDCISIAKENEEIFTRFGTDPIIIPQNQKAIKILQHIRDESHRFGLSYNRKLRKQTFK